MQEPKFTTSPIQIIREAIKAVPAVKWGLGVAGLVAIVVICLGWLKDIKAAVFGLVILIVSMFILVIFAWFAKNAKDGVKPFAYTLATFSSLLLMGVAFFVFTGFFFGWPRPIGGYQGVASSLPLPSPTVLPSITPIATPTIANETQAKKERKAADTSSKRKAVSRSSGSLNQTMKDSPGGIQAGGDVVIGTDSRQKKQ